MEGECEGVVNFHIAAKKRNDDIIFLRKIVRGATDDSYGIEVAKLAGVPSEVVKRAKEVLSQIEKDGTVTPAPRLRPKESDVGMPDMFTALKQTEAEEVAEELKKEGYRFHVDLIGGGPMEEELKEATVQKGLEKEITFHGFLSPGKVREIMEKSHIHLFTSNHLEGWGAVVNEAMNSGCVEVISVEAGAGPFLVEHGVNGLFYRNSDPRDLLKVIGKH